MSVEFFSCPFPLIDLEDFILREITEEDTIDYLGYISDNEMLNFLTIENIPQNLDEALREINYWRSLFYLRKSVYWAIALKNNRMIGTAGFNSISFFNSRADISYDLSPEFWGRGIMYRAVKAILNFSDKILKITRIQATVVINNKRSITLLRRCGFHKERYLRNYELIQGELKDYYLYARNNSGGNL